MGGQPLRFEALEDAADLIVAAVVGAGASQVYAQSGTNGLIGFVVPMLILTFILLIGLRWIIRKQSIQFREENY